MHLLVKIVVAMIVVAPFGLANGKCNNFQHSDNFIVVDVKLTDGNRLYYIDDFGNLEFLKCGVNRFDDTSDLQVTDNRFKIDYFLKKGDRITVTKSNEFVKLASQNSERDRELMFPLAFFKKFDSESFNQLSFQRSFLGKEYVSNPESRNNAFESQYRDYDGFIKQYAAENHLNNHFVQFYEAVELFNVTERKLRFGNAVFPAQYIKDMTQEAETSLKDDRFLFLSSYRNSANACLFALRKLYPETAVRDILAKHFSGQTRTYLVVSVLNSPRNTGPMFKLTKKERDQLVADVAATHEDSKYSRYLSTIDRISSISIQGDDVITSSGKKSTFGKATGNKITYVDFWASWCAPCREEMPASARLSDQYSSKGINFVYISIDKNPAAWQKAAHQIGLNKDASFLMPKGIQSAILRKYGVKSIPRYMIIDKSGKVVDSDAPRPSDPAINQIFNRLSF